MTKLRFLKLIGVIRHCNFHFLHACLSQPTSLQAFDLSLEFDAKFTKLSRIPVSPTLGTFKRLSKHHIGLTSLALSYIVFNITCTPRLNTPPSQRSQTLRMQKYCGISQTLVPIFEHAYRPPHLEHRLYRLFWLHRLHSQPPLLSFWPMSSRILA